MTDTDAWHGLLGGTLLLAGVCITIAALACLHAWRTEQREWLSTNRRAGVRRMLARLHFLNQRNRFVLCLLVGVWAAGLLIAGPPAVFRWATWFSLGLHLAMAVLMLYASVREWRIRVVVVRRAAEIDLLEGSGTTP